MKKSQIVSLGIATALLILTGTANALTDAEVKSIMKKSTCFKCHAETEEKAKDGPSYPEISKDFKGVKNAETTLYKRLTTTTKVKIKNEEKDHEPLKTKDDTEIKAVVKWILSR